MDKLTLKFGNEYGIKPLDSSCECCASCLKCEKHLNRITQRLGEYESTELEPKEVEHMKQENERLIQQVKNLQNYNIELRKLTKLAVEDLKEQSKYCGHCHYCTNSNGQGGCKLGKTINASFCNDWRWQYTYKLKELVENLEAEECEEGCDKEENE